jgi:hypothetical protein
MGAANRCRIARLKEAEAEYLIGSLMTRPPRPLNEIRTAVDKAYASRIQTASFSGNRLVQSRHTQRAAPVPITSLEFDPAKLQSIASQLIYPPKNWRHWLWERSPKCPETIQGFSFLAHLYSPDETVMVFDKMDSKEPLVRVTVSVPVDCRVFDLIRNGGRYGFGIWFLCNPVDGKWHPNPRQNDKPSCRSEESITSFRYVVLESDKALASQWLALIAQLQLRIAAIYTSGGRSVHCLVRIDATSKKEWDSIVCPLKRPLKILGADTACLSAVRLTRLPQCWRTEKQGFQQLLYLCPNPPLARLIDLPVVHSRAETLAIWRGVLTHCNPGPEAFR